MTVRSSFETNNLVHVNHKINKVQKFSSTNEPSDKVQMNHEN